VPLLTTKVRIDDVTVDRCYDDPELDAARDVVADAARPREERAATALRLVVQRRADTERQLLAQDVLSLAGHDLADELERQAGDPSLAGEDSSDALGMAAATRVAAAWQVRGRGMADTVGDEAARTFQAMLEVADDLALSGLRAVPDSPGCGLARLVSGRGRGVPYDELVHRSEVARRRDPLCVPAHLQTLQAVCEKWYGSHESMFDLVRQTLAVAPPGHPVTAVLPVAHLEYRASGERDADARAERDLAQVAPLSSALLAGDDRHPRAQEAHDAFGWFYAAVGQKRQARAHLERVGTRPSWLWSYLDEDPRASFVAVLKEVGLSR
jgi:hypothetical protein